jgi:hypothetical protein
MGAYSQDRGSCPETLKGEKHAGLLVQAKRTSTAEAVITDGSAQPARYPRM